MSLVAIALSAAALAQNPAPLPICRDMRPRSVGSANDARPQRLDKLPPAETYLTVMRTENGCIRPAKVSKERALQR
jgi:hypothetical protein